MLRLSFLLWIAGGVAAAAQTYDCRFLDGHFATTATLKATAGGWQMTFEEGSFANFAPVGAQDDGTRRLLSSDFDPDASAMALLTLDAQGGAFLSLHGHFPPHDAKTYKGECQKENG